MYSGENHVCSVIHLSSETTVPVDKFLERIPPSVIKNGKIIDIRSGIETTIKVS